MRTRSQGFAFNRVITILSLFLLLLLEACSSCSTKKSVTGSPGTQSETSATIAHDGKTSRIVVAFNDETNDGTSITYTASTRQINSGASLMGWSYSDDDGKNWTYGGNLKPPACPAPVLGGGCGWAVLWGDPAIGVSKKHDNVVFMSNLAIPTSKFPAGGINGSVIIGYPGPETSYLGGACIAKSTDAGKTFSNYQCVSNTQSLVDYPDATNGHFYDGGSIVGSNTGEIFAAWVDVYTNQIDVYRSPDEDGTFVLMKPPFSTLCVGSHPRLRTGPDGSLYVAAQATDCSYYGTTYLYMNRYWDGEWGTPIRATLPSTYYGLIDFNTTVDANELTLRLGPSFSYDIGSSSPGGKDAIRLLYTRQDSSGPQYIAASTCDADLDACYQVPECGFKGSGPGNSRVDNFNPEVVAWPGAKDVPAAWQATWAYHYGHTTTVNVSRVTLGYFHNTNDPVPIVPVDILDNTPLCSDLRGYWGDYDAMLRVRTQGDYSVWMRFLTDSSQGCPKRWEYLGESQHIQQTNYVF
jgi:hypothetical protein